MTHAEPILLVGASATLDRGEATVPGRIWQSVPHLRETAGHWSTAPKRNCSGKPSSSEPQSGGPTSSLRGCRHRRSPREKTPVGSPLEAWVGPPLLTQRKIAHASHDTALSKRWQLAMAPTSVWRGHRTRRGWHCPARRANLSTDLSCEPGITTATGSPGFADERGTDPSHPR